MKKTGGSSLELGELDRVCQRAVTFLDNNIIRTEAKIGWHQILSGSIQRVGWVGSAVGLLTLTKNRCSREYIEQIQNQLLQDQFSSADQMIDGGWSIRIISEFPVLEGTAWVLLGLVATQCSKREAIDRAYGWIANNQNEDGGWGSIVNQPSRVHLTCLALRVLYAKHNRFSNKVQKGIDWLKRARNEHDGGWGDLPGRPSSCFHTADVLYTLRMSQLDGEQDMVEGALNYLLENWDPRLMWDQEPLSEEYDIVLTPEKWFRIRIHNFPTAWAVIALLAGDAKHGILREEVWQSLNQILKAQEQLGYWRHSHDHENIYVWGIHDNTFALRFFQENLLKYDPQLRMQLYGEAIIISHQHTQATLANLALRATVSNFWRLLRRNWRILIFVTYCVVALGLLLSNILTWKDVLLGLIVPAVLVIWQVAMDRKSSR